MNSHAARGLEIFRSKGIDQDAIAEEAMMNALVKLLAEENLQVVVSPKFHTAFFDLKNRFVGIPAWLKMSFALRMLFRFHECGHALFSDAGDFHDMIEGKYARALCGVINVCEDDRVDRFMMKRFPGAKKYYSEGYKHFLPEWQKMEAQGELSFADKLNLDSKAKPFFPFSAENDEEGKLYYRFKNTQTVEEVIALAIDVLAYMKTKKQNEAKTDPGQDKSQQGDNDESDDKQDQEQNESGDQSSEENQSDGSEKQEGEESGENGEPDENGEETDDSGDGTEGDEVKDGEETDHKNEKDMEEGRGSQGSELDEETSYTKSQDVMDDIEEMEKENAREPEPTNYSWNNPKYPMATLVILKSNKSNFVPYKTTKSLIRNNILNQK